MNEELLLRFLTKSCTHEELVEVEKWISADPANADWLFGMETVWSLKDELRYADQKKVNAAYHRFIKASSPNKGKQHGNKRFLYPGWVKYAAAIIIVCLLATNIFQFFKNKPTGEVASNSIEVPVGQRVAITLADGTRVWLNSGSILSYPTKFDSKNRVIRLDGEGYFEVTANKERPFTVNTSNLQVTALGTRFNIQAYPDDDIAVSLLEGQVHVQTGHQEALMAANEVVVWSAEKGLTHYKNKLVQPAAQWITGELMFVDERLSQIAKALEKHFGVTIIIDNPQLADEHFTCRTQMNPTLEQVLKLLENTRKLHYTITDQTVHIK